jgi:formylglycine-generating enzyme required for sulfatase activity
VIDLGGGVNMALVWIPPGSFTMGGDQQPEIAARQGRGKSSYFRDEQPQHQVTISKGFWMGKYEVTQGQWQAIMGSNPSHFKAVQNPVEQVSWTDCQEFISRLNRVIDGGGFRLPTEAEWEYACRAGTTTPFHFGNDLDGTMANFDGSSPYGSGSKVASRRETVPVGSFNPNGWGLYDMHGNVWEWCQDAKRKYTSDLVIDPEGVDHAQSRALRGGSWRDHARTCRSAYRNAFQPGMRDLSIGFRIVAH